MWLQSAFQSDDKQAGLFKSVDIDLPPLNVEQDLGLFSAGFDLPELEHSNDINDEQLESIESKISSPFDAVHEAAEIADVWSLDT